MKIHRNTAVALIAAGGYIAGAFALKLAEKAGYLSHDTSVRALEVFTGVALAVYGNFLPKTVGRVRNPAQAIRMQAALRAGGWAFMLGGAGYAVASLLPLPDAVPLAILGSATAYVFGYSAWAFMETDKPKGGSPQPRP
jgi:hypothetical protein